MGFEKAVFVFFEDLAEVGEFFVVVDKVTDVAADFVGAFGDGDIRIILFDGVFHAVELALVSLDEGEVVLDELVEKVVNEALEAGKAPFFGVGNILD